MSAARQTSVNLSKSGLCKPGDCSYLGEMTNTIFHLAHRKTLSATGADVLSFLNRVLTCRLDNLSIGEARYGTLLTPQGKILTDMFIYHTGETIYLDLPETTIEPMLKRLTLLKLRADAQFKPEPDLDIIQSSEPLPDALTSARDTRYPDETFRSVLPATGTPADAKTALTSPVWQSSRIDATIPEFGVDYGETEVFPSDVNLDLLGGVDYKKGCFIGQEVVSRMKRKTEVRKRTLRIDDLPETATPGMEIKGGESTLGTLTSQFGASGLALMRLDRLSNAADNNLPPTLDNMPIKPASLPEAINV